MPTYKFLASTTVGSGGTSSITFSSIPQTYTALLLKLSLRNTLASGASTISFNGSASGYLQQLLGGNSGNGAAFAQSDTTGLIQALANDGVNFTASTFANSEVYIPNYRGSTNKSFIVDSVLENNGTSSFQTFTAGVWTNSSAITQITLTPAVVGGVSGNYTQYSTAYLYGIS